MCLGGGGRKSIVTFFGFDLGLISVSIVVLS
jgi:hypothetical protein